MKKEIITSYVLQKTVKEGDKYGWEFSKDCKISKVPKGTKFTYLGYLLDDKLPKKFANKLTYYGTIKYGKNPNDVEVFVTADLEMLGSPLFKISSSEIFDVI